MESAVATGISITEFWNITPKEIVLSSRIHANKIKTENEDKVTLAYMTALWAARWFSKKPPEPLEKILGTNKNKPKKKMTPEEILSQVRLMNKALGGE